MPSMNFWRQLDVFDPNKFKKQVHVIGCGAVGSHVVDTLIRSGIGDITVYDFDDVEEHNIPNQLFTLKHLGKSKVEAMAEIAADLGINIKTVKDKIESISMSEGYLIMAVDSMAARKAIWESSVKYNPNVRLIETRMAAEYGIIHVIDPLDPGEIEFWEKAWFSDEDAEESACTNRAVATTAKTLAAVVVHSLITWENGEKPPTKSMLCLRPLTITTVAVGRVS